MNKTTKHALLVVIGLVVAALIIYPRLKPSAVGGQKGEKEGAGSAAIAGVTGAGQADQWA